MRSHECRTRPHAFSMMQPKYSGNLGMPTFFRPKTNAASTINLLYYIGFIPPNEVTTVVLRTFSQLPVRQFLEQRRVQVAAGPPIRCRRRTSDGPLPASGRTFRRGACPRRGSCLVSLLSRSIALFVRMRRQCSVT